MAQRGSDGKWVVGAGGPSARTLRRQRQKAREAQGQVIQTVIAKSRQHSAVTSQVNPLAPLPPIAPPPKPLVNHIAILLDNSGSMETVAATARKFANEQIGQIKNTAADSGQKTLVTVAKFSSPRGTEFLASRAHFQAAPLVQEHDYQGNGGGTPLIDAVHDVVDAIDQGSPQDDNSFLVVVLTDGEENTSRRHHELGTLIRSKQGLDNWTFAFLGPHGSKNRLLSWGVPAGNIKEWEGAAELDRASQVGAQSLGNYYTTRASGLRSTKSFFTDLSGVTKADLNKLEQVTAKFIRWQVAVGEVQIKTFIEAKGIPYVVGDAFYELTKPEKVQSHKEVVLEDRLTKVLYGGEEARKLVGLTTGPGVEVRVTPGNHANYRIYVSSTSTNRKLVRGTNVLYKK